MEIVIDVKGSFCDRALAVQVASQTNVAKLEAVIGRGQEEAESCQACGHHLFSQFRTGSIKERNEKSDQVSADNVPRAGGETEEESEQEAERNQGDLTGGKMPPASEDNSRQRRHEVEDRADFV